MASRWICAALGLTLALSMAGCGSQTAGADASRWWQRGEVQNNAAYQRDLADGTGLKESGREKNAGKDWAYQADDRGQVKGFDSKSADRDTGRTAPTAGGGQKNDKAATRGGRVENDLKDAGSDLKNAVKDAARSVGDTAEDALDGMKDAAGDAADHAKAAKN